MTDGERDPLRMIILKLISEGFDHWTTIEKKTCATCFDFATSNTIKRQFYGHLVPSGFVKRIERGTFALTEKGQKLLAALS